jgi:Major Facilitator Superfamily
MPVSGLQWVEGSYSLVFGGLLLLGGRGRRPVRGGTGCFLAGFTLLALASLAGALAAAPGCCWRTGSPRGGAALLAPTSLSLITSIFEQGPERDRAVSVYSAMAALGAITGVVLGGVVTQLLNWRWVLVAALPIALPVIALTPTVVGEHRAPGRHGLLDLGDALTGTLGLASLLYAVLRAGERGWGAQATLAPLAAGVALLAAFVAVERRAPAPLVPLPVLRRPRVAAPNAAICLRRPPAP